MSFLPKDCMLLDFFGMHIKKTILDTTCISEPCRMMQVNENPILYEFSVISPGNLPTSCISVKSSKHNENIYRKILLNKSVRFATDSDCLQ